MSIARHATSKTTSGILARSSQRMFVGLHWRRDRDAMSLVATTAYLHAHDGSLEQRKHQTHSQRSFA
jgi:hypothetical protein